MTFNTAAVLTPNITWLMALDWIGIAIFAVTGALVASRKRMDIFGFMMLGQLPVFWVEAPAALAICLAVSAATFFLAHIPESRYRALLWCDAAGLSLFCVVGADKALDAGAGPFIAVAMGVMTATFGGVIRDILGGESPLVLRKEIYVTAATAGATLYVALALLDIAEPVATAAGFALCFAIRALALHYGWSLPVYRARAGRSAEEVERMRD